MDISDFFKESEKECKLLKEKGWKHVGAVIEIDRDSFGKSDLLRVLDYPVERKIIQVTNCTYYVYVSGDTYHKAIEKMKQLDRNR